MGIKELKQLIIAKEKEREALGGEIHRLRQQIATDYAPFKAGQEIRFERGRRKSTGVIQSSLINYSWSYGESPEEFRYIVCQRLASGELSTNRIEVTSYNHPELA